MSETVTRTRTSGRLWLSLRVLGVAFLAVVLWRVDLAQVAEHITSLRPAFLLAAVALTAPFFVVKSFRWRVLLRLLGIEISMPHALRIYGAGLYAGQFTPGQLGEVIRAHFLWSRGYDLMRATGSVIADRMFDMVILVLVAVPGISLILGYHWSVALLPLVLGAALVFSAVKTRRVWPSIGGWLLRWPRAAEKLAAAVQTFRDLGSALNTPRPATLMVLTTVFAFALNLARFYLLLLALGLSLPVGSFIFGVSLANLVSLLPISVAGVGTREVVLALVFQQAGQSAEGAVAFSLLILVVAYGLNILWGFPAWLMETR